MNLKEIAMTYSRDDLPDRFVIRAHTKEDARKLLDELGKYGFYMNYQPKNAKKMPSYWNQFRYNTIYVCNWYNDPAKTLSITHTTTSGTRWVDRPGWPYFDSVSEFLSQIYKTEDYEIY
jgi:hypothetical protein